MVYAIVVVIALICDQALKYWATANIPLDTGIVSFIPGFLHFTNIHNAGAAFSFMQGARWLFVVLCIIFVLVIAWLLLKNIIAAPGARWAAVFVVAGALGNCIDRILYGYVVDMLEFEFIRFPVFNLADIFITVGAVVFCVCLLLEKPAVAGDKPASGTPKEAAIPAEPSKAKDAAASAEKPGETAAPKRKALDRLPFGAKDKAKDKTESKNADKPSDKTSDKAKDTSKDKAAGKPKRRSKNAPKPYVTPPTTLPRPAEPAIDPADPFAEWERKPETPEAPESGADAAAAESAGPAAEQEKA